MADTNTVFPAVFDATFERDNWTISGSSFPLVQTEVVTPTTITLAWRVTTDVLVDNLRALKTDEGQVDVLRTDDGGYTAVDRANGGNTFTVRPPGKRGPLRLERDVHVQRYEEDLVSQRVDEWDVEVEFVKAGNRTDSPSISESTTGADAEWGFDTPLGQIVSDRVDADFLGTGRDGVERFELTARLTMDQAHSFEAAFDRLGGGRVRTIPDGTNKLVDDTGGDATVSVTSPDTAVVSDGGYVVTGWESRRISEAYQTVAFEMGLA